MNKGMLELGCDGCGAVTVLPASAPGHECDYCGTVVECSTRATALENRARRKELALAYAAFQLATLVVSGLGTLASAAGTLFVLVVSVALLWGLFEGILWFIGY
jgi:hypothetical protein